MKRLLIVAILGTVAYGIKLALNPATYLQLAGVGFILGLVWGISVVVVGLNHEERCQGWEFILSLCRQWRGRGAEGTS